MSVSKMTPGIHHDIERQIWALATEQSMYAFGVSKEGLLLHIHWGPRLHSLKDLPMPTLLPDRSSHDPSLTLNSEEYPAFGGLRYGELAAMAIFADGTRDLDLRFASAETGERNGLATLTVFLHDAIYPLSIALHYSLDISNDLLIRSASFSNQGQETVILERAFSALWHLPRQFRGRSLITLAGQWVSEDHIQQRPLVAGTELIESRHGTTGARHAPWFAIASTASEQAEEVYFGTLAWSGNWVMRIRTDIQGATAITGGIHEHDFRWQLSAKQTFETPEFVAGFAEDGLNGMRRRLHSYTREQVLPRSHRQTPRPVLYNSWEATYFDVNESGQRALAERAASLGVELFVVDDGWFQGRKNDHVGLGDWFYDAEKFPNGLTPLIEAVHALSMQFGIWVEPEMVNPDSDLYRKHPNWVYQFPHRPRSEARNQLVLNVGREDVQEYLFSMLNALLSEHPINFVKWDMNRPISEPGWPEAQAQGHEVREIWVRHTRGVYQLMDRLRAAHPKLSIESCAGGGSRADLGILERADQIWTSDNTNPEARLFIQEGFSLFLPARVMGAWVTDNRSRNTIPLSFSCHVAMLGALGIGGNLLEWTEEEMEEVKYWINVYKEIRHLVQDGKQTWLLSPHKYQGNLAAVQYTASDRKEAIVFTFRRQNVFNEHLPRLRLQQLIPDSNYKINEYHYNEQSNSIQHSGASLQSRGLEMGLEKTPYACNILHLQAD